jgi:predicted ATPase
MAAWHLGLVDLARRRASETLALGRRLEKAYDLAYAHALATFVHIYLGEPGQVLAIAEPLIELARTQHFPFYLGLGLMNRGWARAALGRHAEGIAELREGFDVYRSTGTRTTYDLYLGLLADAQARSGDLDGALRTVEDALAGCVPYEVDCPELLRQRAGLLARRGADVAVVDDGFRRAVELARRMGSRAYELRSSTSWAHWLAERDRSREARAMLEPVVTEFPAGPDTPDLRAARALLAALTG